MICVITSYSIHYTKLYEELPIVIVLSQRGGPSTGLPTYTAQSDLLFTCHAGQGEFPRFIAAPATPLEAFWWAAEAVQLAWKLQIPTFILSDKTFSEGIYTRITSYNVCYTKLLRSRQDG